MRQINARVRLVKGIRSLFAYGGVSWFGLAGHRFCSGFVRACGNRARVDCFLLVVEDHAFEGINVDRFGEVLGSNIVRGMLEIGIARVLGVWANLELALVSRGLRTLSALIHVDERVEVGQLLYRGH